MQNGSTGDAGYVLKGFSEALDNDFLLSNEHVDQHAKVLASAFHHDQNAFRRLHGCGGNAETPVQAQDGQERTTHQDHLTAMGYGGERIRGRPEHLFHGEYRNDVAVHSDTHHEAFDNGHCERQLEDEGGAVTGAG